MKRLFIFLLLLATPAWAAISKVGACSTGTATSGTTITVNLATTADNGDDLSVVLGSNTAAATVASIAAVSGAASFSQVVAVTTTGENGNNLRQVEVWHGHVTANNTGAITITLNSSPANAVAVACHWRGVNHVGSAISAHSCGNPPCADSTVNGQTVKLTSGMQTLTDAGDYLVTGMLQRGSPTWTAVTGQGTKEAAVISGTVEVGAASNTGATSLANSLTSSGTNGWAVIGYVLRATADSGGGGVVRRRVQVIQQ